MKHLSVYKKKIRRNEKPLLYAEFITAYNLNFRTIFESSSRFSLGSSLVLNSARLRVLICSSWIDVIRLPVLTLYLFTDSLYFGYFRRLNVLFIPVTGLCDLKSESSHFWTNDQLTEKMYFRLWWNRDTVLLKMF